MDGEAGRSILVVGVGGGGSRLAAIARTLLGSDCIVVSADPGDAADGCDILHVSCGVLANPSVHSIRGAASEVMDELRSRVSGYDAVVMTANLAGRSGAAISPLVSEACRDLGKRTYSFGIMPFRYEKDRMFQAALSLRRVRAHSDCTIILDNDSMLECNPDLSVKSCYEAGNGALACVFESLGRAAIPGDCLVSAGRTGCDPQESLRDSIKMLYTTAPPSAVKKSIIYVDGGLPVGVIESISRLTEGVTNAPIEVVQDGTDRGGVVLVSSMGSLSKFEGYDPLEMIPKDRTLDRDHPEISVDVDLNLYQM